MKIDPFYEIYRLYLIEFIPIYDVYTTGRKNSYELCEYIDIILDVLKTGKSWNQIKKPIKGNTVYKKFKKWVKMNIFHKIYIDVINKYIKDTDIRNIFIDSSDIANVNGYLNFGYSYKIKNKKSIRLTNIIDEAYCPLFYRIDKSSKHDCKIMNEIIENKQIELKSSYHKPKYIIQLTESIFE